MNKSKKAKAAYWSGTEASGIEVTRWLDKWAVPYIWNRVSEAIYLDGSVAHLRPGTWVLFYPENGNFSILTDSEFKGRGR
jgi:hypothetical protein